MNSEQNLQSLLQHQQNDFLAAYESKLYQISREMKQLKDKLAHKKHSEKEDQAKLAEQKEWYRSLALEQDQELKQLRSEMKETREKASI